MMIIIITSSIIFSSILTCNIEIKLWARTAETAGAGDNNTGIIIISLICQKLQRHSLLSLCWASSLAGVISVDVSDWLTIMMTNFLIKISHKFISFHFEEKKKNKFDRLLFLRRITSLPEVRT
jgi:hypothetical protein